MSEDYVIKVESVSKNFVLPHQRVSSIKGLFTGMTQRRNASSETQHALRDISFTVKKGEFFGIVGRNGSGKSTMLKILAGIYQPTKGSVTTVGKLVPFIELGVGFNPELTGRENVYLNGAMLGFSRKQIESMYDDIVSFAEIEKFMDQKLKNYSSGMQVRLAFSMAIRADADILLIDEVLAVGDADFQRKCFDYFKRLKRNKKTVVFVSHDMNAVREYCDRAVLIEKSKVIASDTASKIATLYTRMFVEQANNTPQTASEQKDKRWGTGQIKYRRPMVTITEKTVTVELSAEVKEDVIRPNFGFSIKDATGQAVLGTNSQIKKQYIDELKSGQVVDLQWEFPNILKDGNYTLDPAVVSYSGEVWDWWEDARAFSVNKEEYTPYIVAPETSLIMKVKK
jgi:ABC-2 type transport system ATP-binding protein